MHTIGIRTEVRGQLCGVASLLNHLYMALGNPVQAVWLHAESYPTKPSHQPKVLCFLISYFSVQKEFHYNLFEHYI